MDFITLGRVADKLGKEKFDFLLDSMVRWEQQRIAKEEELANKMKKIWWKLYKHEDCGNLYIFNGKYFTIKELIINSYRCLKERILFIRDKNNEL